MTASLSTPRLASYIACQLNQFFPDDHAVSETMVTPLLERIMPELESGMAGFHNPYFWRDGQIFLNHLHGDQYALVLYKLGSLAARSGTECRELAEKTYLLNKALHGLDLYSQVALPDACWLAHPVGSVIGRALYQGPLMVMQGCTIGNRGGTYPVLGKRVIVCSHSAIIGACEIGDDVCIGAGSLLIDETIPAGSTVVGRSPNLRVLQRRAPILELVFR